MPALRALASADLDRDGAPDLIAGYETAGGTPVTLEALAYWEVFGSLRWGVYCLKMLARSSPSDRPLERLMIARRASETEMDLLRFIAPRDI